MKNSNEMFNINGDDVNNESGDVNVDKPFNNKMQNSSDHIDDVDDDDDDELIELVDEKDSTIHLDDNVQDSDDIVNDDDGIDDDEKRNDDFKSQIIMKKDKEKNKLDISIHDDDHDNDDSVIFLSNVDDMKEYHMNSHEIIHMKSEIISSGHKVESCHNEKQEIEMIDSPAIPIVKISCHGLTKQQIEHISEFITNQIFCLHSLNKGKSQQKMKKNEKERNTKNSKISTNREQSKSGDDSAVFMEDVDNSENPEKVIDKQQYTDDSIICDWVNLEFSPFFVMDKTPVNVFLKNGNEKTSNMERKEQLENEESHNQSGKIPGIGIQQDNTEANGAIHTSLKQERKGNFEKEQETTGLLQTNLQRKKKSKDYDSRILSCYSDIPCYERSTDQVVSLHGKKGKKNHLAKEIIDLSTASNDVSGTVVSNHQTHGDDSSASLEPFYPIITKSLKKCFNCGRPDHEIKDCPEPYDAESVKENRELFLSQKKSETRYFEDLEQEKLQIGVKYKFKPGQISNELRKALGIESDDPPPYLSRMYLYGYPPAYKGNRGKQYIKDVETFEKLGTDDMIIITPVFSDQQSVDDNIPLAGKDRKEKKLYISKEHAKDIEKIEYVKYPGFNAPIPEDVDRSKWRDIEQLNLLKQYYENPYLEWIKQQSQEPYKEDPSPRSDYYHYRDEDDYYNHNPSMSRNYNSYYTEYSKYPPDYICNPSMSHYGTREYPGYSSAYQQQQGGKDHFDSLYSSRQYSDEKNHRYLSDYSQTSAIENKYRETDSVSHNPRKQKDKYYNEEREYRRKNRRNQKQSRRKRERDDDDDTTSESDDSHSARRRKKRR